MNKPEFEHLDWWQMTFDGHEYVRLGKNNWAQWMGESLEIIQFHPERFEEIFQAHKPVEKEA